MTRRTLLAAAAITLGVVATVYAVVVARTPPQVEGLGPADGEPFGEDGALDPGPVRALFSPGGDRLAVLSNGAAGLARRGRVRLLTAAGGNVVDLAWFPSGRTLLVAEGPVPTGGLVLIDVDGRVRGTVPLSPTVAVGDGFGMAVSPDGRQAALTAVERLPLGGRHRYLVLVDLTTGTASPLTAPGGDDEHGPAFAGDDTVVFTSQTPGGEVAVDRVRTETGERARLAAGARLAGTLAATGDPVSLGGRVLRVLPLDGAPAFALGRLPAGAAFVALGPDGRRAVAGVRHPGGGLRLRAVALRSEQAAR